MDTSPFTRFAFRRPLPLRWHLILLLVGTLLPVTLFVGVVTQRLARNERETAERRLALSVRDLAAALDREMSSTIRVLSALAESEPLDRDDLPAFHREAVRIAGTQPSWLGVLLLAPDGRQLVSSAEPWGTPLPRAIEMESLRRTVATGRPTVGDLALGKRRRLAFPVRVPVIRDGEVRYVLTATMTPQALADLVVRQLPASEEWTRTLVDGRGIVVARTRAPERFVGQPATPSFLRRIRETPESLERTITMEGTAVYTAFRRAQLSGWTAVIAVPVDVVEGPARRSTLMVAGSGLALLLLSGWGAFLLSRHVSRSIESAAAAAATLATGGRPRVEPSMVSEAARLATALEASADLLLERQRQLEGHLELAEVARAEAEAANRAKDEFLAMLGHELRNPLGPIRNGVYVLRESLPADAKVQRIQEMIERQLTHITRLLDDLLEVSRISRGKVELRRQVLDLREVVRGVHESFKYQLDHARIGFFLALPDEPVWIEGDETRLAQCLGNLLHNALKFTPAGGHVSLSLMAGAEDAEIVVQDNGGGIDPALLPKLFQPFAQGPQSLARDKGGLGLGLALVKGLIGLHGGTVQATSEGEGRGSRFTLRLPRAAASALVQAS
ncbi:MAG TPA: ATP-binding protein [Thermoanaerobaculia bacterium]|nr:ATP-binding protein [Thermoanaerobaculia bacterium]